MDLLLLRQNDLKKGSNTKRPISQKCLQQVCQSLDESRSIHEHPNMYNNFKIITILIKAIIQGFVPQPYQHILPNQTLQHLLSKFSHSTIIYGLLLILNHQSCNTVNFRNQKHKLFINEHPTQPTLLLESLVQILEEQNILDQQLALRLIERVEEKMEKSMKELESDPKTVKISHNQTNGVSKYFHEFQVVKPQKGGYKIGTVLLSDDSSSHRSKADFYQFLFQQLKKNQHFSQIASKIIEEIILRIGIITYLETIKLSKEKTTYIGNKNEFPMQMTGYKEIADLTNYQLQLSFATSSLEEGCKLRLTICLPARISLISKAEFYENQQFTNVLKERKIISTSICVENLVYQISASKKIGKGSFGSVYPCQSFQLHHCKTQGNQVDYFLKRKNVAAKEIALQQGEAQQYYIPLNRQHLIISLIKELSHREMIKRTKRQLGMHVEGDVPGINRIVPLVQYFKRSSSKASQTYLIMFQLGSHTLSNKLFLDNFVKREDYDEQIYDLFYKIFEGLNFLHYQINKYYPNQLKRYFIAQKEEKRNKEYDHISQLIQNGKNGILHRDIKPSNIIVNCNSRGEIEELFIIDFGMAKITDFSKKDQHTNCGSNYYMAPEIRNGMAYDEKVDIWSTGVFLFEMYARNTFKLYSTVHSHSMNQVNKQITTFINRIAESNKAWRDLLTEVLTVQGENRKQADETLRFLIKNQIELKGNKARLCKQFEGCINYVYTTKRQDSKKTIEIYPCKENYNLVEMMDEKIFKHIKISDFLSSNIHLPAQQHKYALVSMFHLIHSKKLENIQQLLTEMAQLELLVPSFEDADETNDLIVIKESKNGVISSLQQMQQTIMVASTQEEHKLKTLTNFVLALTNTTMKGLTTQTQAQNNIFYCNGIVIASYPLLENLFSMTQDYSDHLKASQYMDGQILLINKNISSTRSNIMIAKETKFSLSDISEKVFQLLSNQSNGQLQLMLQPTNEKFIANQNVSHIMSLYQKDDTVTASFNGPQIIKILEFLQRPQYLAAKILKMKATICYEYKFVLSLYLTCKDPFNFTKIIKDILPFINDSLKLQAMLRQFCGDLYYIIQHPKLLRTQKMIIKPIVPIINILNNTLSKHFYQNRDVQGQKDISYLTFSRYVESLSGALQQIPQFLTSEKERLKMITILGQRILLLFESLSPYFKLWLAEQPI